MGKAHRSTAAGAGLALLIAASATAAPAQVQPQFLFDLPSEPLSKALRDVAVETGRNLIAPGNLLQAHEAPPLSGKLTAEQAVGKLLEGTGLRFRLVDQTLVIEPSPFPPEESPAPNAQALAITVTGTRIRGGGSASPVIVTTRRALEEQGVTDLVGFARILPQNYTGGQNPGIAGGGEQGGQDNVNNSATLNLRGLGPDATLTLLDGHRIAYDALDQGIDIAAIPLGAIDRIEVIADGASALYGSDAVAGVANVILRRDYQGLETTATDGGNVQQEYSLVGGNRWSSGGFMVALDHSHTTPIFAGQRDYARTVDPSLTLTLRNTQLSGVIAGHQQLTDGLSLEIDGYAMDRRSYKQTPFLPTESVFADGLVSRPQVRSYALTPTLRAELPGHWQASISATHAVSRTRLDTSQFFDGSASRSRLIYDDKLSGVEATAEGPLFETPGGEARLAIGGGLRKVSLHDKIVDFVDGVSVPFRDLTVSRDVQFAYGELSLPLVRPQLQIPLIDRLTLSGALRYERWKGIDAVATPKLGLVYQPIADVTVRGTWGRSFKVPTLDQVSQAVQGFLLPGFVFTPGPQPAGATVLLLGGGNSALRSERATTWSATAELRPHIIAGLVLEASYFNVDYRDRVASPIVGLLSSLSNPLYGSLIVVDPTAGEVNALIATFPQPLVNETGEPFDPSSVGAIIDDSLRNTARQRVHGFDLSADYRLDLRRGERLLLSAAASYLRSNQQLSAGQPAVQMAGIIFNPPHWRAHAGATWDSRTINLSAFVNYVGSTLDNRFPTFARVGPFVTLDLSAALRTDSRAGPFRGLELRLSALNVLNEQPDIIRNDEPEAPPFDSTNQSPVGRFIGLSVRKVW
jgi:iron complex outermembrane recepter protein